MCQVATEKDGYVMYHYVTFARLLGALSGAKALTFEEELHELLIIPMQVQNKNISWQKWMSSELQDVPLLWIYQLTMEL